MRGQHPLAGPAKKRARVQLDVERLEDRAVPANFTLLSQNFDQVTPPNLPTGWTTQTLAGNPNAWTTSSTVGAFISPIASPPNSAVASDSPSFSDSVLVSPVIRIPNLAQGDPFLRPVTLSLSFNNSFDLESFDGEVLEVSINGGAFQDITAVGGTFTSGGYTSTEPTTPTPPASALVGRQVWNGTTFGPVLTQVNLTNVIHGGDSVQFRWRVSSDNTVGSPFFDGVAVDDVQLTGSSGFNPDPNQKFAVAPGAGALQSQVFVYDARGQMYGTINPFPGFRGELHVAVGDVTGDGVQDVVVAPGRGGGPIVAVYDGSTGLPIRAFFAYPPTYTGGVNVAVGDVTGSGHDDIITAPAGKGLPPIVNVFDGQTGRLFRTFLAYPPVPSIDGVTVAAADITGDGRADIVTGVGAGAPPIVEAFDGASGNLFVSFYAYPPAYMGGVNVAAGDFNGDGFADIFTAPQIGSSLVNVFDGATRQITQRFYAYDPLLSLGGTRIGVTDVEGNGRVQIITANGPLPGISSPEVRRFNSNLQIFEGFYPFEGVFMGGGFVS